MECAESQGYATVIEAFLPEHNFPVMALNPENVDDIHKMGGTILGSSRGGKPDTRILLMLLNG
jgi:6-phosphofructokinase